MVVFVKSRACHALLVRPHVRNIVGGITVNFKLDKLSPPACCSDLNEHNWNADSAQWAVCCDRLALLNHVSALMSYRPRSRLILPCRAQVRRVRSVTPK